MPGEAAEALAAVATVRGCGVVGLAWAAGAAGGFCVAEGPDWAAITATDQTARHPPTNSLEFTDLPRGLDCGGCANRVKGLFLGGNTQQGGDPFRVRAP